MNIERIIITFNPDGTFRGASTQDFGGLPVPVSQAALGGVGEDIGQTLLSTIESKDAEIKSATEKLASMQAELEEFKAFRAEMVAKVADVLQSGDPEKMAALAVEFLTPEEKKIRAAKLAQLEALKSELGIA